MKNVILWIMRDAGLKSETCHYKTKFRRRNFFILIRKALNLLKGLAFSHSERIYREPALRPGSVPGSQPLGLPSHFSLAAPLHQNTLWGHPPATAASVIPKVGGYMRNITQPWAVLWFAPKILQGHYASFLPQIHLLSALEGPCLSPLEPAKRLCLLSRNTRIDGVAWRRSSCHSKRRSGVWKGSLVLESGGTPEVSSSYRNIHTQTPMQNLKELLRQQNKSGF